MDRQTKKDTGQQLDRHIRYGFRQIGRQLEIQMDRQTNMDTDQQVDGQTDVEIELDEEMDILILRQMNKWIDNRKIDGQKCREREMKDGWIDKIDGQTDRDIGGQG